MIHVEMDRRITLEIEPDGQYKISIPQGNLRRFFIVNEKQLEEILELIDAVLFEKEGEKFDEQTRSY